jgi:oxygen-dependent protoporphyrinogen oxidase
MEQMKKKDIVIVGAGVSGLSLLHLLCQKYKHRPDVTIKLFERSDYAGGTVHSQRHEEGLFETGPNGFLGGREHTLKLIEALGLTGSLITAEEGLPRFVDVHGTLHEFPMDPKAFLRSRLLSVFSKMRVFLEPLIKSKAIAGESVYDFAKRRFGVQAAEMLVDPFVAGIYAGDARSIVTKTALPKLLQWESQYGSILRALRQHKKDAPQRPQLHSFVDGMGQFTQAIAGRYKHHIHLNCEILKVFHRDDRYVVSTKNENFKADELYVCTPAYVTSVLLKHLDAAVSADLAYFNYAPVVVAGILAAKKSFVKAPQGYGYLVPSNQNKLVLGVLFESNVFAHRAREEDILLRVMIGGARHATIYQRSKKELLDIAFDEIESHFPTRGKTALTKIHLREAAHHVWLRVWEKAIPQYDQVNMEMNEQLEIKLKRFRDLHLLGNYRGGVAFNDCIENAFNTAEKSSL